MKRKQGRSPSANIEKVRARVEHWRKTRHKRSPMPEDVWEAAASLARIHGVYRIARDLRLNYENLKKRVGQALRGSRDQKKRSGGFVELGAAQLLASSRPSASQRTEVELSDGDGSRLTVRLADGEALDVLGLAETFWSRR